MIVDHAVSLPSHSVPNSYLIDWGAATGGALTLLAALGGVSIFRSETAWPVVVLFSMAGGFFVALGYWFGISGQMESGSALCGPNNSCDISWGLGAAALAVGSAVALAVIVTTAFGIKKLTSKQRARSSSPT